MSSQNIYDNEIFFNGYKQIRDYPANANILIEQPELLSLLPNLKGKRVLDLGCGSGDICPIILDLGAESVTGIDISKKMLNRAHNRHLDPRISFINMDMEKLAELKDSFDVVISSLSFHYISNFDSLITNIHNLLTPNGYLVFSQVHPVNTCIANEARWIKDDQGKAVGASLINYNREGKREIRWFVDNVVMYHRTFSTLANTLTANNFLVEIILEPVPGPEVMTRYPEYQKDIHKCDFLLIKARKSN